MSENAIKSSVVIKVIAHIFLPLALFSVLLISWGNSWEHFLLNFSYFATSIFVLLYLWIFLVINQSYRTLSCPSSWWLKLLSYWRNKSTGSWIKSTLWQKRSLPLKRHSFKKTNPLVNNNTLLRDSPNLYPIHPNNKIHTYTQVGRLFEGKTPASTFLNSSYDGSYIAGLME